MFRRSPWLWDAGLAVLLCVVAWRLGNSYVRGVVAAGGKPEFYQVEFGPAVMLACGHGYAAPNPARNATLTAFLAQRGDTFSCSELQADAPLAPLTGPQATWKYLIGSVGLWWRFSGIAWSALTRFGAVLFAANVVLSYFLMRMVAGRVLALAGAAAVMMSPLHLGHLSHLRDYSKAPFMVALLLTMALLARGPMVQRRTLVLCAVHGLVLGIGIGFRNDLLITIPPFVLLMALFLPGGVLANGRVKAIGIAVAAATFLAAGWPLLSAYREGGGAGQTHVALLGLMSPFDVPLGVSDAGVYEFGYAYNDGYLAAMVSDYAARVQGVSTPIRVYGPTYDRASAALAREIVRLRSADVLVRAVGAMVQTMGLPATNAAETGTPQFLSPELQRIFELRSSAITAAPRASFAAVIIALALACAIEARLAALALVFLVYFGGYPALQFQARHFFHLTLIPIVAAAFVGQQLLSGVRLIGQWRPSRTQTIAALTRLAIVTGSCALALVVTFFLTRAYQQRTLRLLFQASLDAAHEPLRVDEGASGVGWIALGITETPGRRFARSHPGAVGSDYLRFEFSPGRCDGLRATTRVRYNASNALPDFTRALDVPLPADGRGSVVVLMPVYYYYPPISAAKPEQTGYGFSALELPVEERDCLSAVERVDTPPDLRARMTVIAAPGWEGVPLHQVLTRWEAPPPQAAPEVYTAPERSHVSRHVLDEPLELVEPQDLTSSGPGISVGSGRVAVDGVSGVGAPGAYQYLLTFKSRRLRAGDVFIADGHLTAGGLSIGVVRSTGWAVLASVHKPGQFVVVLTVPSDGDGTLVISNELISGGLDNHFDIRRAGWRAAARDSP